MRIDQVLGLQRSNVDLQQLVLRVRARDIYRLSRILGHASVTTTQIYLRSTGIDVIREGHDRLSPLILR